MPENRAFSFESFVMPNSPAYEVDKLQNRTKHIFQNPYPDISSNPINQADGLCVRFAPLQRFEPTFQSFHNYLVSTKKIRSRSVFIFFLFITQQ